VYDPEASCDVNGASMASAIGAMTTGEVTKAVRDASTEAGPVTIGDWIGLVRGEGIVAVSGSSEGAAIGLLQSIVSDDREIVTIIEGAEATPSATEAIRAWLAVERSDVQVECHRGGQPLYPYLFGVE